jgi:hypothetical protein
MILFLFLVVVGLLLIGGAAVLIWSYWRAVDGYEDDSGFHTGEMPPPRPNVPVKSDAASTHQMRHANGNSH